MKATLDDLLKEKDRYEKANENGQLQSMELKSIANSILLRLVDEEHLEAKEKEAYEWAKKQIRG